MSRNIQHQRQPVASQQSLDQGTVDRLLTLQEANLQLAATRLEQQGRENQQNLALAEKTVLSKTEIRKLEIQSEQKKAREQKFFILGLVGLVFVFLGFLILQGSKDFALQILERAAYVMGGGGAVYVLGKSKSKPRDDNNS